MATKTSTMFWRASANLIDVRSLSTGEPHNGMLPGCRAFPRQAVRAVMPRQFMGLQRRTNKGPIQYWTDNLCDHCIRLRC